MLEIGEGGTDRSGGANFGRVVDTTGWVSTKSHSSPSGDDARRTPGRVENLLCEHLELAACTEHNRMGSYIPTPAADESHRADGDLHRDGTDRSPLPANHRMCFHCTTIRIRKTAADRVWTRIPWSESNGSRCGTRAPTSWFR